VSIHQNCRLYPHFVFWN